MASFLTDNAALEHLHGDQSKAKVVPCFRDLSGDKFAPITSLELGFIKAIVAVSPDVLAPILTQLDSARTCDDGEGWLVVRDAHGAPCAWREGYPFDVPLPSVNGSGPQGCYSIIVWFDGAGQLHSIEFLLLEHVLEGSGPVELKALTAWLSA